MRILVEPAVIVETAARKDALEKRKNTTTNEKEWCRCLC
jgi:hypothetical protein